MIYGDFEDWNVDDTVGVADQWDTSAGSVELAVTQPYSGTQNLMSIRQFGNTKDSVIPFRNRIRVMGDARNQANPIKISRLSGISGEGMPDP